MEFRLKYVSYSGSDGEQIKTVFPESWTAEKIIGAIGYYIKYGTLLSEPSNFMWPSYSAEVDGVSLIVHINMDGTISSGYPIYK